MVRGTGRQVIVVKSPDPQVFEEAIFVLREDWIRSRSADRVVEEARRAAGEYLKQCAVPRRRFRRTRSWAAVAAAGTFCAGLAWVLVRLLGAG